MRHVWVRGTDDGVFGKSTINAVLAVAPASSWRSDRNEPGMLDMSFVCAASPGSGWREALWRSLRRVRSVVVADVDGHVRSVEGADWWSISPHARSRAAQMGVPLHDVVAVLDAPSTDVVAKDGGRVAARDDLAVVYAPEGRVAITVLWHGQQARADGPARLTG